MESVGVTIGKFNPPHLGHLRLIEEAARQVRHLYVLLCDRPDQTLPAAKRSAWLDEAAPANVTILITPDDLPAENAPWAKRALEVLPSAPDLAFTSEPWGREWAEMMGAHHVAVDPPRRHVPISATLIRDDMAPNFRWLVPAAREALARRVVVVGAESTGKSTLAEALAHELGAAWGPEYGRLYWEGRRYLPSQAWNTEEFVHIATAQTQLMHQLAHQTANGIVVSDTDALVTQAWHQRYLTEPNQRLAQMASANVPALYLVCCPDFDWVQDGTRESNPHRQSMHESILSMATASGAALALVRGDRETRLRDALIAVRSVCQFPKLI